ncbi:MAG: short-chain dehydrogenase [Meiothermus sp.]
MTHEPKIALVTGANRGIGLEIVRQLARLGLQVILTARDATKGRQAVQHLKADGLEVGFLELDVTDAMSVLALKEKVEARYERLDVLVNNAGILLDEGENVLDVEPETVRKTLESNLIGPWLLCEAFVPGMVRRKYGRVVNISSTAGQLSSMGGYAPAYSVSKAALNALTRQMAYAGGKHVLVNTMCPGWVRTDMGGSGAPRSVEKGAETAVWLATLPKDGPTGGFFRDKKAIPW